MAEQTCPAADLLVRRLHALGARDVFGYPGGQLTPVYDALHRLGLVRHYLARHEQAAAFMADGYARSSGRPLSSSRAASGTSCSEPCGTTSSVPSGLLTS